MSIKILMGNDVIEIFLIIYKTEIKFSHNFWGVIIIQKDFMG